MGGSCSSDLDETRKENKQLKNRIMLYEAGITDSSIHASQTNIGLLNLSSESNSECTCSSSWISIIEVVGILMVLFITVYILYGWSCRYLTYRKGENERRKAKLLAEMKKSIGMDREETRLELSHCDKDRNENTFRTWDVREIQHWRNCVLFIFNFTIKITLNFNYLLNTNVLQRLNHL